MYRDADPEDLNLPTDLSVLPNNLLKEDKVSPTDLSVLPKDKLETSWQEQPVENQLIISKNADYFLKFMI